MRRFGAIKVLVGFGLLACVMSGCSDDSAPKTDSVLDGVHLDVGLDVEGDMNETCSLRFATINGKDASTVTYIAGADDQDTALSGVQIEIVLTAKNLADGTEIVLSVSNMDEDLFASVSGEEVRFGSVTLPANAANNEVVFTASAQGCEDATHQVTIEPMPVCEFTVPYRDVLGKADDRDPATATFDYDVVLKTTNAVGGKISLRINDASQGTIDPIATNGISIFSDMIFTPDENKNVKLFAQVEVDGLVNTCEKTVMITVDIPRCAISLDPPAVQTYSGVDGLGAAQDVKLSSPAIDTKVVVESENSATVRLLVDGQIVGEKTADTSGALSFDEVELLDGDHELSLSCTDLGANTAASTPISVTVDSIVPDAVSNFKCALSENRSGKISCSWNRANNADVKRFAIRYLTTGTIDSTSWDSASSSEKILAVFPGQGVQGVDFINLELGKSYSFGIRALDDVLNASDIVTSDVDLGFKIKELIGQPSPSTSTSKWGAAMATGDFNCDGYTDLAIGDETANNNKGRVVIYSGNPAGYLITTYDSIIGTMTNGHFGAKLAALPNFFGQTNCDDLAVVASHDNTSDAKVYIYRGGSFSVRTDAQVSSGAEYILQLPANAGATEQLGEAIANAGDFNGDGLSDLAIRHSDTTSGTASAIIIWGDSTIPKMTTGVTPEKALIDLTTPAGFGLQIIGTTTDSFGSSLGGGYSLDGDSFADLIIGAPKATNGAVYVVSGAASGTSPTVIDLTSSRVISIIGATTNVSFGDVVAYIGDMNNDGIPEFAVSDTGFNGDAGEVYMFNFSATIPATAADAVFSIVNDGTGATNDKFGIQIASGDMIGSKGGDINRDGFADLLIGAQEVNAGVGAVYVFKGVSSLANQSTQTPDFMFSGASNNLRYGTNLCWAKDINYSGSGGFNDVVIADPLYLDNTQTKGMVYVYF